MKPSEQYFPVLLFIMLHKVVLTFEYVDEILKCNHSNDGYWASLSCGAVYCPPQGVLTFEAVGEILNCTLSSEISLAVVFVWCYLFSVLNKIKFGSLFFLNLFISTLKSGNFFLFFIFKMFLAIVSVSFLFVGGDISCSANPVSCVSSQSKQWGNLAGCRQTRKRKQRRSESKVSEISSPVYYYSPLLLLLVF